MSNPRGRTIAFYNVENLFDTVDSRGVSDEDFTPTGIFRWNEERYAAKLELLARITTKFNGKPPLILGLSEIENRQVVEDLTDQTALARTNYEIIHKDSPDHRGIDVALIYDTDIVTHTHSEFLRITFPSNRDVKTRDVLFFFCEIDQEEFLVVVNHWPSRRKGKEESEHKRMRVAECVRKKIEDYMFDYPKAKIIVMGDFNDEPKDKSLFHVLKAKTNKKISSNELYNLNAGLTNKVKGTCTHLSEWLMLDQIMVNRNLLHAKGMAIKIKDDGVTVFEDEDTIRCRTYKGCEPFSTYSDINYLGGASDHLPVFIELE